MIEFFSNGPIIAAFKDKTALSVICNNSIPVVFMLSGNISELGQTVRVLTENNKRVFVHVDLIEGLRADREGIRFIAKSIKPYGIISTKTQTIKQAKEYDLKTVFRVFMIDASAFDSGVSAIKSCKPDAVEVMPGLIYDVINELCGKTNIPIIAGGMIKTELQARKALQSGARAISSTCMKVWDANV